MLLHPLLILPVNLRATGSRNNTARNLPGDLPLRTAPVESFENAPTLQHHSAFIFSKSELEQLIEIALTERGLEKLL